MRNYLPWTYADRHLSNRFGKKEAIITGLLWGFLVTTSETLSQPALYLEPREYFTFYGRIALHYTAGGVMLALLILAVAHRLHGWRVGVAACLAIVVATAFSLAIERMTIWFIPVFSSDTMLEFATDFSELLTYVSWNFAFYGGVYVLAFLLFQRSQRMRGQYRKAEWTRLMSEAALDRAVAEDRSGLLQPALLLEAVTELARRYSQSADRGDRLLDHLVRFLRSAIGRLSVRHSNLSAELDLARNYARLGYEIGRRSIDFQIDRAIDAERIPFPTLILLRLLDEISRASPAGALLKLKVSGDQSSVTLRIASEICLRAALQETTERRANIALCSAAGANAAIHWPEGNAAVRAGNCLEVTLPSPTAGFRSVDKMGECQCQN